MLETLLHTSLQLGSLYALVALAVCISFRFLSFPDLGIDGSYVLGAAITASIILSGGSWYIAISTSALIGFIAGIFTATIYHYFRINRFFCGIITSMVLYSINIRILGGANIGIHRESHMFSNLANNELLVSFICLEILIFINAILILLFHTI